MEIRDNRRMPRGVPLIKRDKDYAKSLYLSGQVVLSLRKPKDIALFISEEDEHWGLLIVRLDHIEENGVPKPGVEEDSYITGWLRGRGSGEGKVISGVDRSKLLRFIEPGTYHIAKSWTKNGVYFEVPRGKANIVRGF